MLNDDPTSRYFVFKHHSAYPISIGSVRIYFVSTLVKHSNVHIRNRFLGNDVNKLEDS
jgi:hypothetical protein